MNKKNDNNNNNEQTMQIVNLSKIFEGHDNKKIESNKKIFASVILSVFKSLFADFVTDLEKKVCAELNAKGINTASYKCGHLADLADDKQIKAMLSAMQINTAFKTFADTLGAQYLSTASLIDKIIKSATTMRKQFGETSDLYVMSVNGLIAELNKELAKDNTYIDFATLEHEIKAREIASKQSRTQSKAKKAEAMQDAVIA